MKNFQHIWWAFGCLLLLLTACEYVDNRPPGVSDLLVNGAPPADQTDTVTALLRLRARLSDDNSLAGVWVQFIPDDVPVGLLAPRQRPFDTLLPAGGTAVEFFRELVIDSARFGSNTYQVNVAVFDRESNRTDAATFRHRLVNLMPQVHVTSLRTDSTRMFLRDQLSLVGTAKGPVNELRSLQIRITEKIPGTRGGTFTLARTPVLDTTFREISNPFAFQLNYQPDSTGLYDVRFELTDTQNLRTVLRAHLEIAR